jgi:DNA-binding PadR family transcriptional regulator
MTSLGEFELLVLIAILQLGDEAYGVPICDEIERRTGRAVARGAMYVTLERLARKGLVTSAFSDPRPERGGKARRYFRVSRGGRQAVRATLRAMDRMREGVDPLLEKS